VMGQKQQLMWDLPALDSLKVNAAVYEIAPAEASRRIGELAEMLDVREQLGQPVRKLSLGERMKCELVAALVHRPRLLFLDEPTIGLDVSMQATIRDFIRSYNERSGATILLTSHYMDDVAALCPRVVVIDRGRLSYDGGLDELARRIRPEKRLVLHLEGETDPQALARVGKVVSIEPARAVLQVPQEDVRDAVGRALATLPVKDLNVENAPLEEVMSELFARSRAAREADEAKVP